MWLQLIDIDHFNYFDKYHNTFSGLLDITEIDSHLTMIDLLAPPSASSSVAFNGWSSLTTRLPSDTFPWNTANPLPFFNFEFITGSCKLDSEKKRSKTKN